MRYSALYVDSIGKWAVVDTLSDGFILQFHKTEKQALKAAKFEEKRWDTLVAGALPAAAAG
jgi:3-methyladenine DNA glycosylase AlkD